MSRVLFAHRLLIGLSCLLGALVVTSGAAARAGLREAGARSPAPTRAAISAQLAQATGLSPDQIAIKDVCSPAQAGHVSCDAQQLVVSATGDVAPVYKPRRQTGSREVPSVSAWLRESPLSLDQPASEPTASTAPQPFTPAYLQEAYDLSWLSATAGRSDKVAIVDAYDDPDAESDLAVYRATYGLPSCTTANGCFSKVNENGESDQLPGANSDWDVEISLDLDAVSALCPKCQILLVEAASTLSSDMDQAIETAASLGAAQISNSYSAVSGGPDTTDTSITSISGAAIVAATGDDGYDGPTRSSYPAALPYVTAAGGTTLAQLGTSTGGRGFGESTWNSDGGSPGSGCDLAESKPSWQTDPGCSGRAFSDLSADADPYTGLLAYDTAEDADGWELMGGTSLATPLIAAYYALSGHTSTQQWAYQESAELNDPTVGNNDDSNSGSHFTCEGAAYICNAGVGYDGPTGIGSISGDVVAGAPGVGAATVPIGSGAYTYATQVTPSSVSLIAGIYPNGFDTTYRWEYGTTSSYGQSTEPTDIGGGNGAVTFKSTIADLAPQTTYHYRLVAQNSAGTTYGYDYTLVTPAGSPPQNQVAPSISGTAQQGHTVSVTDNGAWNPTGTISYQWQRCDAQGLGCQAIASATGQAYTLQSTDVGSMVLALVTETNNEGQTTARTPMLGLVDVDGDSGGASTATGDAAASGGSAATGTSTITGGGGASGGSTATATSTATGASTATGTSTPHTRASKTGGGTANPSPPQVLSAPTLKAKDRAAVGQRVHLNSGVYASANSSTTQFWRCDPTCAPVSAPRASSSTTYTLSRADAGAYLRAKVTVSGPGGRTTLWAAGLIGPVKGPNAVTAALTRHSKTTLRTPSGVSLVVALVSNSGSRATVSLVRAREAKRALSVWACTTSHGTLGSCTHARTLGKIPVSLSLVVLPSETLQLVVKSSL